MNHFISGIIKIALLEGSIALLLMDRVLGDRFLTARRRAFGLLAGTMVFAWANYGALRHGVSVPYVLLLIPVILACAWMVQAGFGPAEALSARMKTFRAQAGGFIKGPHGGKVVAVGLSAALVLGWVGWGINTKSNVLVHPWEQFHFYLGAKHQKQLGYFNLYKAAILADRETVHVLDHLAKTRDLTNFEEIPVATALADADAVRARFSDAEWEAFKADWAAMAKTWRIDWARVMTDHGNSNSPAWSIITHPLTRLVPVGVEGQAWLGWLDMLLMIVLWLFAWQTFGHRVAAIGLLVWAAEPLVFDYLSGSLLRWDWLFALGMAACFLKRGRYGVAGAFFGYAVATKLFPLFFGVAMLINVFFEWRKTRKIRREHLQFAKGTVLAGALAVAISAAMFGPGTWAEYAQRIQVAQVEKYYSIQYSLKTVYLQFITSEPREWVQGIFPAEIKQARPDVDINDHTFGFWVARLLFTALIAILLKRANDLEAFLMGPLLVFTWLTVNMYYWNMLGLMAMGLAMRKERPPFAMLIGLQFIFMVFYLYQHLNRGGSEGYAVAWMMAVGIAAAAWYEWKDQKKAAAAEPAKT
ncbi:MAG: glycosyltransferase 87 family protein [Myxococcota bacterium]